MANTFIKSIKTITQSFVNSAGFDKTRTGQVITVNQATNTYSVKIDGYIYRNVKAVNGATYNVGDIVKVVIPCNQATQVYIEASVLSDSSLGNKVANAQSVADQAKSIAESKNKTYYQASAPTSGMTENDIWIDSDDNDKMYIYDGSAWVYAGGESVLSYATCTTDSSVSAKVATIVPNVSSFSLVVGIKVMVNFSNSNTAYPATLNINGTGAKSIYYNGQALNNITAPYISADKPCGFVYDGSHWILTGKFSDDNTTDCTRYNVDITSTSAISANALITLDSNNKAIVLGSGAFDISKPILRVGTPYTSGHFTQNDNYSMYGIAFDYTVTKSGFSGVAGTPVYLVGTLNGYIFTPDSAVFTTTIPSTIDNKVYMLIGQMITTTTGTLYADHPLFAYGTNGFCQYAPRTSVGVVEISVDSISYPNQTATLRALLFVDGVLTTPSAYQWSYGTSATTISGATSQTLNITSASAGGAGLGAIYNCAVTW